MNRHEFLKLCGLAGLGFAAPVAFPSFARAESKDAAPYEGPFYVVFNAAGGWDTTYLMDPKGINDYNRLYKEGDILTQGAHKFAPTAQHMNGPGMSNENFYKEFGNELLAINGLDYSVNNHAPGARYMATGKLDSMAYPTFAALIAATRGPQCPLAFLTFGNYSNTGNLVAMSRITYLPSLKKIANADYMEGEKQRPYHSEFAIDLIEKALQEEKEATITSSTLPRVERAQNMLYAAQNNSKALERVTPYVPSSMPKARMAQQSEVALASFKAGVCVSANFSIGQFDSHNSNDPDQMKLIPEFLEGITYFIRRAEELGLRDKMVIVIQSEMGRTPTYNKTGGKDHWSVGSMLFMGKGIKGNRVIGATDEQLFAVPVNTSTLACNRDSGIKIRPEHIHTALREFAGIATHPMSKQFPLGVADKDRLQNLWG